MRIAHFSVIFFSVLVFIAGCGRKSPQPGEQTGTGVQNPDSTGISAAIGAKDSLPGSASGKSTAKENLPFEGQPAALMDTTLVRGRAGAVYLGMPVDSVSIAYGRANVRETVLFTEGHPSPALEIHLPGGTEDNPSLLARIGNARNKVYGIDVFDSRFKTARGIGPVSSFGELRKHYPVESVKQYEIGILANVNELRMAFELDPSAISISRMGPVEPNRIPDTTRIIRVIVGWQESLK